MSWVLVVVAVGAAGLARAQTSRFFPPEYDYYGETVIDAATGLTWEAEQTWYTHTWAESLTVCTEATTGDYDDWRLPKRNELLSLIDFGRAYPASEFPSLHLDPLVSSSSVAADPTQAWVVDFDLGVPFAKHKSGPHYVRCVRDAW